MNLLGMLRRFWMPSLRTCKNKNRPYWVGFLLFSKTIIILENNTL